MPARPRAAAPRNVLFVGNSFTARNDLPGLIAALAAAGGTTFRHHLVQAGGASLRAHWNAGHAARLIEGAGSTPSSSRSRVPCPRRTRPGSTTTSGCSTGRSGRPGRPRSCT